MEAEIKNHRRLYVGAREEFGISSLTQKMISSFAFGYLKLESDSCLKLQNLQNLDRDIGDPDFWEVSFANVKDCISSMEELSDWKVCTVPIADHVPTPLAMLTSIVPVLGVGLHQQGLHVRLRTSFKKELVGLIAEIEEEDWRLDLDRFEQ
jgi:hypothetical protein